VAVFAHQLVGYVGTNITFTAPDQFPLGNETPPSNRCYLWVKNAGAGSRDIVIVVPGTTFEQGNPDVSVTITAGTERLLGPLDSNLAIPTTGLINWIHVNAADLTAAVVELQIPPPDLP
jgi:hypothetical protein